ncbi:haloalkane dehalogenase [Zavarzinia compransoris]|uniref:haloalkane dehalogenase n=1 Tax=Zavarzinia marina TaxID=2911065 RepID=UPI001F259923|nr:haloalkane dehalogenase [Zavarzinia marina]MCF4164655.1 haloalkane dehalogenase [Zavarzinia marina]
MKILRTPEARFADLPDYPFAPHHVELGPVRMHYVDEGPRDGPVVLLLHGEPTWSYLYRKMIPPLAAGGCRVLAPDLIGFGKSDKPAAASAYSYQAHVDWVREWLLALDLRDVTLFCQDWGSLIGLRVAAEMEDRFARICVSNGFLPTGEVAAPPAFRLWRAFARFTPVFPAGRIVDFGSLTKLSRAEIAAYDAPFPSAGYKVCARLFPSLVPTEAGDPALPANRRAWQILGKWTKPFLCIFGADDPILGKADSLLIPHVPGAAGQPHDRIRGGHFIQEDRGDELAARLLDWLGLTSAP